MDFLVILSLMNLAGGMVYSWIQSDLVSQDSLIKNTLGDLSTEFIGGRLDSSYERIKEKITSRYPKLLPDRRQSIEKLLALANLESTQKVCIAYRDEIKGTKSEKFNLIYINEVETHLRERKRNISTFARSILLTSDDLRILLERDFSKVNNSRALVEEQAGKAAFYSLPKADVLPTRFKEMMILGWQVEGEKFHWFNELSNIFAEKLRESPELYEVIQNEILKDISFTVDELLGLTKSQSIKLLEIQEQHNYHGRMLKEHGFRLDRVDGRVSLIFDQIADLPAVLAKVLVPVLKDALREEFRSQSNLRQSYIHIEDLIDEDRFFVNRNEERREIGQILFSGERKMVIIRGVSGDGKTSLAIQILHDFTPGGRTNSEVDGIVILPKDKLNLREVCKKADKILGLKGGGNSFQSKYDSFKSSNIAVPNSVPTNLIRDLVENLSIFGNVWFLFDNLETVMEASKIIDNEIDCFIAEVLGFSNRIRLIITSQKVPLFEDDKDHRFNDKIRVFSIERLPIKDAKLYLREKGKQLREEKSLDLGLVEAGDLVLDEVFNNVRPTPMTLVSFVNYMETTRLPLSSLLADKKIIDAFRDYDFENPKIGARFFISEQYKSLSDIEKLVFKTLAIFRKAVSIEVLKHLLSNLTDENLIREFIENNSFVRRFGERYEILTIPKEVINNLGELEDEMLTRRVLHSRAAEFFRSCTKPKAAWQTINDLEASFEEIYHLTRIDNYVEASQTFIRICEHLRRWGYSRIVIEYGEELNEKAHGFLKGQILHELGNTYKIIGKTSKSLHCYEEASKYYGY